MSLIKEMRALLSERNDELTEASEIEASELPKPKKDALDKILKRFGLEVTALHEGIHGFIFDLAFQSATGRMRYAKDDLVFLTKLPGFRWMEVEMDRLMVGI